MSSQFHNTKTLKLFSLLRNGRRLNGYFDFVKDEQVVFFIFPVQINRTKKFNSLNKAVGMN